VLCQHVAYPPLRPEHRREQQERAEGDQDGHGRSSPAIVAAPAAEAGEAC
jgi:hypothetical protein